MKKKTTPKSSIERRSPAPATITTDPSVMDNEEVLTYKDIILRKADLDILGGPCYLNDQIIGFYFSYLSSSFNSEDILLVPPSVSFWLANCGDSESVKDFLDPLQASGKKLIVFTVNDNDDLGGGESGTHWSMLVYGRKIHAFVHHDSMEGVNNLHAMKLYDAVKGFVGCGESSSAQLLKGRNKKNKGKEKAPKSVGVPSPEPSFVEGETPQQSNGYDCGLYVLAIARAICMWHSSKCKGQDDNWFSAVEEQVDASLELNMRTEITRLIEDLKVDA